MGLSGTLGELGVISVIHRCIYWYVYVCIHIYNHPELDRLWDTFGIHLRVLSKIIFYLLQDGCMRIWVYTCVYTFTNPGSCVVRWGSESCDCSGTGVWYRGLVERSWKPPSANLRRKPATF